MIHAVRSGFDFGHQSIDHGRPLREKDQRERSSMLLRNNPPVGGEATGQDKQRRQQCQTRDWKGGYGWHLTNDLRKFVDRIRGGVGIGVERDHAMVCQRVTGEMKTRIVLLAGDATPKRRFRR